LEFRAIHDRVAFFLTVLFVHDCQHAVAVHRHERAFLVTDGLKVVEFDDSGVLGFQARLFRHAACLTADGERSHREPRSRFTDGLRGDDAHSLTDLHEFPRREVTSVAAHAGAATRFAGQYRADLHALDTGGLNRAGQIFRDLLIDIHDHATFVVLDL